MKKQTTIKKWVATLSLMALWVSLSACASTEWREEVLLHDGGRIIVDRAVERGGRHEAGQKPPYSEQSLTFTHPVTNQIVKWEDKFSEDIGSANFLPMLLDIKNGVVYLVAYPMGCLSYNKWGRPNPPYVIFKYQSNEWQRISLQELPAEINTPNLIFSMPDIEVEKAGERLMSAEMIKAITAGYRQPEYKTILREELASAGRNCAEMVYDGKGGWIGVGWFRRQPTYGSCLKYCVQESIRSQYCPCSTFFKGK